MSIIKKPHEISAPTSVKILIYGQPGIGKTTLALSAPSPLLLDFDGGVHRVRQQDVKDTVQVRSWEDIRKLMSEDLSGYQTLVIDTAGKMLDFMSQDIISGDPKMGRKDGQLALQGYGVRKGMFQRFVFDCGQMGKHLVFVAHDKEEKDGDNKIVRPEIGGSSSGDLIKELDLVGYMEASGKVRTISFDPCEKFYGKNTCGLDPLIKLGDLSGKNDFLTMVTDRFAAETVSRGVQSKKYTDLMEAIRKESEGVADADGANTFVDWAKGIEPIWDAQIQAAHMIRDRAKALGLTLDKSKKYTKAA
jgi:hypothetical protein